MTGAGCSPSLHLMWSCARAVRRVPCFLGWCFENKRLRFADLQVLENVSALYIALP
jgi:hypothetical protein